MTSVVIMGFAMNPYLLLLAFAFAAGSFLFAYDDDPNTSEVSQMVGGLFIACALLSLLASAIVGRLL